MAEQYNILFVGDVHGNTDFMVQTALHNNDQYMIVVPGNHDDPERIAQNSHGIPSGDTRLSAVDRGATWEVAGVKIGFCGGAISVDRAGIQRRPVFTRFERI